jgi:hypothetical protein
MARARRREGITEDEHRVLLGELKEQAPSAGPCAVAAVVPGRISGRSGGRAGARFATRFLSYDSETRTAGHVRRPRARPGRAGAPLADRLGHPPVRHRGWGGPISRTSSAPGTSA